MASFHFDHRLNPFFSIKECMTCGALYTADFCCSKGGLEDNIFVPKHPQNCATCGNPVDGLNYRSCAFYCGNGAHIGYNCPPKVLIISNPEQCNQTINELPQTLPSVHLTCNSGDKNLFINDSKPHSFNVSPSVLTYPLQLQFENYLCELCGNNAHYGYDCSPQFPFFYEHEPYYNQNLNNYFSQNSQSYSQQYLCCANCGGPRETFQCQPMNEDYCKQNSCYYPNSSGFDHPQPPQVSVDHQGILQVLNKMKEKLEEIKRDRRKKIEDMSIKEMRHEQQLVDYKIKEITNDLGIKRFHGEKIDEEYERDCEITIRKLKQDFNEWGSKIRKKEKAYNEEQYSIARRRMLSITFDDDDEYSIQTQEYLKRFSSTITPVLPIEEPDNSLSMGDEHLDTTLSIENIVPTPSEFEGISDDTSDVPNCDNVESDFVESLINRDTSIVYSSKIDPILEEFVGELAHIAPIPPGIVEADFDPNDDTSSDDDSFKNIEYVDATPSYSELVNDVDQEEKNDHTEETRSGSTTTHANYSLPENDSFLFEIEPNQEVLISIDNSNNFLLGLPEFESFHFDPSFPRPPPDPPDVRLDFKPDTVMRNNEDFNQREIILSLNVEDVNTFTFVIWTFLPFFTSGVKTPFLTPASSPFHFLI
ncbi:hypothetical protein Tco_1271791 [Tanacetum coccineum]